MSTELEVARNVKRGQGGGQTCCRAAGSLLMPLCETQYSDVHAGIVMLMIDTRMEPAVARSMVQGAPDTLHSEFPPQLLPCC